MGRWEVFFDILVCVQVRTARFGVLVEQGSTENKPPGDLLEASREAHLKKKKIGKMEKKKRLQLGQKEEYRD